MIIGADHIALSCTNVTQAGRILEACGMPRRFDQMGIPNAPQKLPLLVSYQSTHDIGFHASEDGGIAVELTSHGKTLHHRDLAYLPVFRSLREQEWVPSDLLNGQALDRISAAFGQPLRLLRNSTVGAVALQCSPNDGKAGIDALVVVGTIDDAEIAFWTKGLGFRSISIDEDAALSCRLQLKSPIANLSLDLLLVQGDDARPRRPTLLDQAGFPCLALLSTNLERSLADALVAGGKEPVEPFVVTVNGRRLNVVLLRSPNGTPVEIIQAMQN